MKPKGEVQHSHCAKTRCPIVEDTSDRGLTDFLNIYCHDHRQSSGQSRPIILRPWSICLIVQKGLPLRRVPGTRLAAAVVVWFGRRASYFYGVHSTSTGTSWPLSPSFLIMCGAKAMRCDWADLWGVVLAGNQIMHGRTLASSSGIGGLISRSCRLDYIYDPSVRPMPRGVDWVLCQSRVSVPSRLPENGLRKIPRQVGKIWGLTSKSFTFTC
jgi:hypothetical protein